MQSWIPDLTTETGPKYAAIATALEDAIRLGRLRPGERLPPQRDLARTLAVDLTTVTRAYNAVRQLGLIEGTGRLGSFVRNHIDTGRSLKADAGSDDTGMNMPPQPAHGLLGDAFRNGMTALLRASGPSALLQYQPLGGAPHDRIAGAGMFTARGLPSTEEEVIVTSGGQNALHAIVATTLMAGDTLCTGPYVYPGLLAVARRHGLRIAVVDGDEQGLDPDALAAAAGGARAVYLVPTNDNPTATTMGEARRQAIADVARANGLIIIEDDAYGRLPAEPLRPIALLAPEITWHIASTSKIISPALRVAHVRAPTLKDAWRLASDAHDTAVMAPPLNAALVSAWLHDGSFDRLVDAVRAEAIARQHIVSRYLAGVDHAAHPEGYHIWLRLDNAASAAEVAAVLRPEGLSAVSGTKFAVRPDDRGAAVRVSIGGAVDQDRLRRAFRRLDAMFSHGKSRLSPMV